MATMNSTIGQYLKYEAPHGYSRDDVTVVSGQNLAVGTVVGRITASGKVTAYAPGASDGSQNAMGVMYGAVDATSGDKPGVIVARHAVVVDSDNLVWSGSPTAPQKATAIAALKSLGILSRKTV